MKASPASPWQYFQNHRVEFQMLLILASMQFFHSLDFVVLMPLGPALMRSFQIGPSEFGWLVSSYMIAAALFGFIVSSWMDRFDRKSALLVLYSGFIFGTALCGVSKSFEIFLAGRVMAGSFAGLMTATVFAIVGDRVPNARRGQAMGIVMSAFSVASVVGVPVGLGLAEWLEWHWTFGAIALAAAVVWCLGVLFLPPSKTHLQSKETNSNLWEVLIHRDHWKAFAFTATLMVAGFSVIPYIAPYFARNVGIAESDLFWVYLVGGSFTFFTGPWIGRLSDRFGRVKVYQVVAGLSIIPILGITHLPEIPLALAVASSTVFMILVSGRFVPAMALITSSVPPRLRGAFMSVNNSIQNLSAALAVSGVALIMSESSDGEILGYPMAGFIAAGATLITLLLCARIRNVVPSRPPPGPTSV